MKDYEDQLDFCSEDGDGASEGIEMEESSLDEPQLFHPDDINNLTLLNNHDHENDNDNDNDRDLTDGSLNSESVVRPDESDMGRLVNVLEQQTTAIQQAIELFTVNVSSLVAMSALREDKTSDPLSAPPTSTSVEHTPPSQESVSEKADNGISNNNTNSNAAQDEATDNGIRSPESILLDIQQIIHDMTRQNGEETPDRVVKEGNTDKANPLSAAVHRGLSSILMYIQKIIDNPKISR